MNNKIAAVLFLSLLSALALLLSYDPLKKTTPVPASILGKWRVIWQSSGSTDTNITYEFFHNGTYIEKFRTNQLAGEGTNHETVDMDGICTYKFKFLGKNKYRLFSGKCIIGGSSDVAMQGDPVLHVTFKNNKVVTYVVSREGDELFKDMFESDKSASDQEKEDPAQREQEVWERIR